jgi:hypothetical protein
VLTQSQEIEKIIILIIIHTFVEVLFFFLFVVDEFDKNQGMKSNSYTQQHLKDQNHVPHNTFPGTRQERQRDGFSSSWVFP